MARILIVEDQVDLARLVRRLLVDAGYEVDLSRDGPGGLALARAADYDLAILDLRLPGTDGVAVLKGMLEVRPAQKVLVLSAMGEVDTKVRLLELGASDFLAKPFEPAELLARTRALLRRPVEGDDRFLRSRHVRLDLHKRQVEANGGTIPLSTREFLLLEHLLRRRGELCTREQLLEQVWGYSFDPGTNVVDVYVRRLRTKIGAETIRTVRNGGYYVEAV